jgi:hypothetical protein
MFIELRGIDSVFIVLIPHFNDNFASSKRTGKGNNSKSHPPSGEQLLYGA